MFSVRPAIPSERATRHAPGVHAAKHPHQTGTIYEQLKTAAGVTKVNVSLTLPPNLCVFRILWNAKNEPSSTLVSRDYMATEPGQLNSDN